jgi:hypothetical protein
VGLVWTSDEVVAEADTYTTHIKCKRQTSISSGRFKAAIAEITRLQTYALDRTATGIGFCVQYIVRSAETIKRKHLSPFSREQNATLFLLQLWIAHLAPGTAADWYKAK